MSGVDGSGKTTQLALLERDLLSRGLRVERVWYRPGYSRIADWLRLTVRKIRPTALPPPGPNAERDRSFASHRVRAAWMLCAQLDALVQFGIVVRWKRFVSRVVLCDRYLLDSEIDLAWRFGEKFDSRSRLWRAVTTVAPTPNVSVVLWVDEDTAEERLANKREPFPDDKEGRAYRRKRYEEGLAELRAVRVDGSGSPEEVHGRVNATLSGAGARQASTCS